LGHSELAGTWKIEGQLVNEHSGWIAGQQVPQSIGRGWWLQVKDRSMLLAGLASGRFLGSTDLPFGVCYFNR
jgi:hypothetical protein